MVQKKIGQNMKENNLVELFRCNCNDPSHELVILADGMEDISPRVSITVRLRKDYNIFKLLGIAGKYIFGMRSIYGDFDEVPLDPDYSQELQKVIDVLNQIREKEGRQTSDKSKALKVEGDFQELFICECKDTAHQFIVSGYDFKDDKSVYLSIFLSRDHSIFRRIWTAFKYLIGCHCTYEHFGETIIDLNDTDRLQAIVDYLKTLQGESQKTNN